MLFLIVQFKIFYMLKNPIQKMLAFISIGLMYFLSFGAFAQNIEENLTSVISVRAPVWTEELGEVPLDQYTREELAQMVRDFWTPERMRNAIPAEIPVIDSTKKPYIHKFLSLAQEISEIVVSEPVSPKIKYSKKYSVKSSTSLTPSPATGMIFYYNHVKNTYHSCTGSAINSTSERIVATAGHCVYNGKTHQWHFKERLEFRCSICNYRDQSSWISRG